MLKYSKILCAFEFDAASEAALSMASLLAEETNATLYVLHIARVPTQDQDVPLPFDEDPRWVREARERLTHLVHNIVKVKVNCVIDVRSGVPDNDIARTAEDLAVDLIVMATHGRTGLDHFIQGSITEEVIREAACPVLVLHGAVPKSATT